VGDSEVDVLTAKNAGVPCIAVTWGFRDVETLRTAGAEYFCHTLADLPQMIETILKR
jgi:phosphoglycolate phosphatase